MPANDSVRDITADEVTFHAVGLGIHPVKNGVVGIFPAVFHVFHNAGSNKLRLSAFVRRTAHDDFLPVTVLGPEPLSLPLLIVRNDRVCRVEDILGRAVVLLQTNDDRIPKLFLKAQNVFNRRTAEFINTLVVITHNTEIVVFSRKQADQTVLRVVGILILIHQNITETVLVIFQHIRKLFK